MPGRWLLRRLSSKRLLVVLLATGLVLGLGGRQAWAWYQLRAARDALARHHPDAARDHLARCLKVWPHSESALLLDSRAARQSGDLEEADRRLRACQRLHGGTSDEIALEWALLRATGGAPGEVEEYLQRRIEQEPELAPLVWEALAEGYIRLYRILDAVACLDQWLRLDPDNLRALELRGMAYQNGKSARKAADDFHRVIVADPTRSATRRRLVNCLLDMGSYEEALPHLEYLRQEKPNDPDVQVRLARCQNMLGRGEQARQLLDAVLAKHPENLLALRTRGQFALADGRPGEAEDWLRRAVRAAPEDYLANHLLFRALQQQDKGDEARAQLRKAETIKDRVERLGELRSRKLSVQPLDPALHYEMGVLLLRGGHKAVGESWLLSALALDPDYRPAHAALADYYQSQGDSSRAAEHRRRAQSK